MLISIFFGEEPIIRRSRYLVQLGILRGHIRLLAHESIALVAGGAASAAYNVVENDPIAFLKAPAAGANHGDLPAGLMTTDDIAGLWWWWGDDIGREQRVG